VDQVVESAPAEPSGGVRIILDADKPLEPGTMFAFHYPGGEERGLRHLLQAWDGTGWVTRYQILAIDPATDVSVEEHRNAWAPAAEEAFVPSIDFSGPAPHRGVIPPPATPGSYRLCGESTMHCSKTFLIKG
jgi:hypothetical protein